VKLHVKLNHKGYIPQVVTVTEAKKHEINELKELDLCPGDIMLFDRGYFDLKLFSFYCEEGIYVVNRLKSNVVYTVIERRDVSKYKNISSDQIIEFSGQASTGKSPLRLRRIRVKKPETGKYIVFPAIWKFS
jgi:hypothetical protein